MTLFIPLYFNDKYQNPVFWFPYLHMQTWSSSDARRVFFSNVIFSNVRATGSRINYRSSFTAPEGRCQHCSYCIWLAEMSQSRTEHQDKEHPFSCCRSQGLPEPRRGCVPVSKVRIWCLCTQTQKRGSGVQPCCPSKIHLQHCPPPNVQHAPGQFALSVCASPWVSVFLQWPDVWEPKG